MAKEAKKAEGAANPVRNAAPPKDYKPRMRKVYEETIRKALLDQFKYDNEMQVPRLDKIVLNMGVGEATGDSKKPSVAAADLALIAEAAAAFVSDNEDAAHAAFHAAEFFRMVQEFVLLDGLECRNSRSRGNRIASERGRMHAGPQAGSDFGPGDHRAACNAAAQSLGQRHHVGLNAEMLVSEPMAGAAAAGPQRWRPGPGAATARGAGQRLR